MMGDEFTIITGCNRGIGRATLELFANRKKNVIAVVRTADDSFIKYVDDLSGTNDVIIKVFEADFANEADVSRCAKEIIHNKFCISSVINNVGIAHPQRAFNLTTMDTIKNVFQVNFFSPLLFTQLVSRLMIKKGGSIVFVTSVSAYDGGGNIEYSSSKAAIIGEVHRLALELNSYNIRVNGIAPGLTNTDMKGVMNSEDTSIALNMNIMKRMGEPEEIAQVIYFLSSKESSFMTGQIIRVDGGIR